MNGAPVDDLRKQLRDLGYLSTGIERWFAADPWRSRSFWSGLLATSLKAATAVSPFAAAPLVAVMLFRNRVDATAIVSLAVLYVATSFLLIGALVIATGLLLRSRSSAAIENPGRLNAAAGGLTAAVGLVLILWWMGFARAPSVGEIVAAGVLVALLAMAGVTVFAAALLSFTIHETRRIPLVRRTPRTRVIVGIGSLLLLFVAVVAMTAGERSSAATTNVPVSPTARNVALVAIDGLDDALLRTRLELLSEFVFVQRLPAGSLAAPPERWATIGTGTPTSRHGVHAVEGVRLQGSRTLLQFVSSFDPILLSVAPTLAIASREPLPPTARTRDYVWEALASRGVPAIAVNWWTSPSRSDAALLSIAQSEVFSRARGRDEAAIADQVDSHAIVATVQAMGKRKAPFVTCYLPALDILLHRLPLDSSQRVTASVRASARIAPFVRTLRARGYDVVLVGATDGGGVVASTIPLRELSSLADVAPTLLDLFGFPASEEMAGRSALPDSRQSRIASYGSRERETTDPRSSAEYYEKLRSLGYIR